MKIEKEDIILPQKFPFGISSVKINKETYPEKIYHWHQCLEITHVISGKGFYYVDGKTYNMIKGDLIIFNNVEPHAWEAVEGGTMEVTVIIFAPSLVLSNELDLFDCQFLSPFNNRSTNFSNKIPWEQSAAQQILYLIKDIEYEHQHKMTGYSLMIKTKLLNILTLLVRHFQDEEKVSEHIQNKSLQLMRLQKAIEHINENFTTPIRLDELAAMVHMSPNYFSTFFKQTLGTTAMDYMIKLRILRAQKLINTTQRTLLDIALDCGFNNMSNFYRTYKKFFGHSPSAGRDS